MMNGFDAFDQPGLREWQSEWLARPSPFHTLSEWVGFEKVMVSMSLAWPTLVELRGCILLPWGDPEKSLEAWWERFSGDRIAIENNMNHVSLVDVFPNDDVPESALNHLGLSLERLWPVAFAAQFPEWACTVLFANDESTYGPSLYVQSLDSPNGK